MIDINIVVACLLGLVAGAVGHWAVARNSRGQAGRSAREGGLYRFYANAFRISTSAEEFVVEFGTVEPGSPSVEAGYRPDNRITFGPFTAKRLLNTIHDAVQHYEAQLGTINVDASKRFPVGQQ